MDVSVDDVATVRRDADVVQQTGGSPIEPDADPCRRAWLACPNCDHGVGCSVCQSSRDCDTHWQHLLKNHGTRVFLQCPTCFCVWTVDASEHNPHAPAVVRDNKREVPSGNSTEEVAAAADTAQPASVGDAGLDDAIIARVHVGDWPRDILPSANRDLVYVMTADSVKAVSSFHHVVASVPVGPEPKQMLMSSDGSRIYVTGYDGSLSIVDVAKMTAKTLAKQRSTAAAVSPNGDRIYLAHDEMVGDGTRTWISTVRADGASVAFVAIDNYITGLALSRDGRRLYVASAGRSSENRGGTISVVDTSNHKTVDTIAMDAAPDTLAVDAEGLLYITHYHTNSLSVVDPATHCAITIAVGDAPMDVVQWPHSVAIYAANLNSVTAIDTVTGATKRLEIGELPRQLSVSADGRRHYATDFAHGTIWALDTSDNSVVATVDVGARPAAVTLGPRGDLLYVTDSRAGTLTVISTTLIKPNPQ
jgi:DNA-binding beta-propeller fold protein YncE